jgi:hypothetical protein
MAAEIEKIYFSHHFYFCKKNKKMRKKTHHPNAKKRLKNIENS